MNAKPQSAEIVLNDRSSWLAEFQLRDGHKVRFRHVKPEDEPLIAAAIGSASRQTLLHRFFSPITKVSPEMLRRMLAVDQSREVCIVGLIEDDPASKLICGARYIRLEQKPEMAEIALTVHDRFQRHGIGKFMMKLLVQIGLQHGIREFEAYVMNSNVAMIRLFKRIAPHHVNAHYEGDVSRISIRLSEVPKCGSAE